MLIKVQLRMITYSAVIVLLFVTLAYVYNDHADATSYPSQHSAIRIVRIHLHGLGNGKIESAKSVLEQIPGVVEVKLNPPRRLAVVSFDVEKTSLHTIGKSLHEAGYTPLYR